MELMNPTMKSENSNFKNGTEENATCSSPEEDGTSAENHGPVSLAQTMYDEIVGYEFDKERGGGGVSEPSTNRALDTTIETSFSSLTNVPVTQAELIEDGDVSYESNFRMSEGVSGSRHPTLPNSTPETPPLSHSKRRVWIGVGTVVAATIAIVLGLTLPKSASGVGNSPSPSPLQPSGFASPSPLQPSGFASPSPLQPSGYASPSPLEPSGFAPFQSAAKLQSAVDDYLAGGERKALATSTYGTSIVSWNVSDITNFDQLFSADRNPIASTFNEPLGLWDVSKATSMREMFLNAAQFDQPLKTWNVSSVVDMTSILSGATSFRQDLCDWRAMLPVSCILTDSMQGSNCVVKSDPVLDAPTEASFCSYCSASKVFKDRAELLTAVDAYLVDSSNTTNVAAIYGHPIGMWQVSRITDFSELFSPLRNSRAAPFNEDISTWDTSAARTFRGLFRGGYKTWRYVRSSFNKPLNNWATGSVTDMSFMFYYNLIFNQSLAQWDTAKVTNFSHAFLDADAFNQPLNDWVTSSAIDMNSMFRFADRFNQRLDSWDVGNVRDMEFMFYSADDFNNGAANESRPLLWDTSNVVNMNGMFGYAINYNQPMEQWDTSSVVNMSCMFCSADRFNQRLDSWDVGNVRDMGYMFNGSSIFNNGATNESRPLLWDTSNVVNMKGMFAYAYHYNQPMDNWNISSATDMAGMFAFAISFNQSLCSWLSQVSPEVNTTGMFVLSACPEGSELILLALDPPNGTMCFQC